MCVCVCVSETMAVSHARATNAYRAIAFKWGLSKNTGGSPLLDNMELLQEDESSLGLSEQGMESAPTPQETVGPYLPRTLFYLSVCLSA